MDVCFLFTSILRFNPGLEDSRFGSDVVMIDLEDSVHTSAKAEARDRLAKLDLRPLVERGHRFGIRVNSLPSIGGIRDLDVLHAGCEGGRLPIDYLMIPKVRSAEDCLFCLSVIEGLSPQIKLFPLVETPEAVENVYDIAAHSDALLFGQADINAAMYRSHEGYLAYARGRFCVACAREGIPAVDTKGFENLTDMPAFEKSCVDSKSEGFTGKSVIHPKQVPFVKKTFFVPPEELENYRKIISHYAGNEAGFAIVDGQVIAPPFVARARKLLDLYGASAAVSRRRRAC
jgi:citrate lyase subunit beta/citryl-CoA lyase/(S)-citramalyl-CoA lyase